MTTRSSGAVRSMDVATAPARRGPMARLVILAAALLCGPGAARAPAQTSWAAGVSGAWDVGANWSTGRVPNLLSDVVVAAQPAGGVPYTVTVENVAGAVRSMTVSQARSTVLLTNDTNLRVIRDYDNSGGLTLTSSIAGGTDVALRVRGTLTNQLIGGNILFDAGTGGARTFAGDLANVGQLTVATPTSFNKEGASYTNIGRFAISPGASLNISGTAANPSSFTQGAAPPIASGSLATNGGFNGSWLNFKYVGGTITGGVNLTNTQLTFQPPPQGLPAATFNIRGGDATSPNRLTTDVPARQTVALQPIAGQVAVRLAAPGGVTNSGRIAFDSALNTGRATLVVDRGGTLNNQGTIDLGTLNAAGQPQTGGARTFFGQVANAGRINVNADTSFLTQDAQHVNQRGGVINFNGPAARNPAQLTTLTIAATKLFEALDNQAGATITGNGRISLTGDGIKRISNSGTIAPGVRARPDGVIAIEGGLAQTSAGILDIRIGGTRRIDDYDVLTMTGEADLDGLLQVSLTDGFTPAFSDAFTVLDAGSVSGIFANAASRLAVDGGYFDVIYSSTDVTLTHFIATVPTPTSALLLAVGLAGVLGSAGASSRRGRSREGPARIGPHPAILPPTTCPPHRPEPPGTVASPPFPPPRPGEPEMTTTPRSIDASRRPRRPLPIRPLWATLSLAGLGLILAPATATAQGQATYNIAKNITVTSNRQVMVPTAVFQNFEHVWTENPNNTLNNGTIAVGRVDPLNQAAGYTNIKGYEGFPRDPRNNLPIKTTNANGVISANIQNGTNRPDVTDGGFPRNAPGLVPVTLGSQNVVNNNNIVATRQVGPADGIDLSAQANARLTNIQLPAANNNNTFRGMIQADGSRDQTPQNQLPGAETYAFSYAGLRYTGQGGPGTTMRVTPNPTFAIGRQAFAPNAKDFTWVNDPVSYKVTDASGNSLLSGTALDIHAGTVDNANISLDSTNHLHIGALPGGGEAFLSITMNGDVGGGIATAALAPAAANAGTLLLDIVNQQVTQESASGVFSSLALPGLNTFVSSLDLNLPTDIFSFNLTMPDGSQNFELDFDNTGFTDGSAVPAPGSIVLLLHGMVGLPLLSWLRRRSSRRAMSAQA
jgi:hypothetical protein